MQRPARLFLVWGADSFNREPSHKTLVWKEGSRLCRIQAGQATMRNLQTAESVAKDAPLTSATVVRELRDVGVFFPDDLELQPFDVSDHIGRYHPRIRRDEILDGHFDWDSHALALSVTYCKLEAALASSVVAAKPLFEELEEVCTFIEPDGVLLQTYGHRLRHLLITACTEVESAWRSVFVANSDCGPHRRLNTADYVRLADPMKLRERSVLFTRSIPPRAITPFANWDATCATGSLPWYDGYNATKHNREMHLDQATLENVIDALAALYIMLVAQFGSEATELLPARPFVRDPEHEPEFGHERYIPSPFDDGPWQMRKLFAGP